VKYRNTESPRSYIPHFCRVRQARTLPQLVQAVRTLAPMLQRRGQRPDVFVRDLEQLAQGAGLRDSVAPLVHDVLTGGAR
jgi:hypothetical protein